MIGPRTRKNRGEYLLIWLDSKAILNLLSRSSRKQNFKSGNWRKFKKWKISNMLHHRPDTTQLC